MIPRCLPRVETQSIGTVGLHHNFVPGNKAAGTQTPKRRCDYVLDTVTTEYSLGSSRRKNFLFLFLSNYFFFTLVPGPFPSPDRKHRDPPMSFTGRRDPETSRAGAYG